MHCDPTSRNANSDTALHLAVMNGHLDIVQFFISDQHCDPNIPSYFGVTPLHYAVTKGHMDIVKFLTVEKHCDPLSRDIPWHFTPIHYAANYGYLEIVKFFIEELKCPPDIPGKLNITPLQMASMNRSDIAQYLCRSTV